MWGLAWAPIHSFIQQWLVGAYSVPSTVCGTEDTAADKTNKPLLSRNSYPSKGSKNKIKTPCPKQTQCFRGERGRYPGRVSLPE